MNFLQLKKSFRYLLLIALMALNSCLQSANKMRVIEIYNAVAITEVGYKYSKEAEFDVKDRRYSLRAKSIYETNGKILKVIIYKPEGALEYSRDEILSDANIAKNLGFPLDQSWNYQGGILEKGENEKIQVEKISEEFVQLKRNGRIILFKIQVNHR